MYLSINYIIKLEYYYVLQVYWEFAVFGVANWRQSAWTIAVTIMMTIVRVSEEHITGHLDPKVGQDRQ
jgi:hypothetical protein